MVLRKGIGNGVGVVLFVAAAFLAASPGRAADGEEGLVCTLEGHKAPVTQMHFAPAGKNFLIAASKDDTIRLWNTRTGESLAEFRHDDLTGLEKVVVSWTAGHSRIAVRYRKGGLVLWDMAKAKDRPRVVSLEEDAEPVALLPGDILLVRQKNWLYLADAANPERPLKSAVPAEGAAFRFLWDTGHGLAYDRAPSGHSYFSPAVSPDGKWATVCWLASKVTDNRFDGGVRAWSLLLFGLGDKGAPPLEAWCNIRTWSNTWSREGDSPSVRFSPDGKALIAVWQSGRVEKWTIDKRRSLQPVDGPAAAVSFAGVNPRLGPRVSEDGNHLLAVCLPEEGKYQVVLWDLDGTKREATAPVESDLVSPVIAMAPDGSLFALTARDNKVNVFRGLAAQLGREEEPAPRRQKEDKGDEVEGYVKLLGHANARIRKQAAIALGEMGTRARAARPALQKALSDPDKGVQEAAAEALDKVGRDPQPEPRKRPQAAGKPEDVRLLIFCNNPDSILRQERGESDDDFARRCQASSEPGAIGLTAEIAQMRARIQKNWPSTQKAEDLATLRALREKFDKDLVEFRLSQAGFDSDTMAGKAARRIYQESIERTQRRLRIVAIQMEYAEKTKD